MPGSQRSEYCLKQASACASKATKTAVPDIKEAYSNLEQAWLQLAPDFEGDLSAPGPAPPAMSPTASQYDASKNKID